jgi:hypothetical protein
MTAQAAEACGKQRAAADRILIALIRSPSPFLSAR